MKILIQDERPDALEFLLEGIVNHGFNASIARDDSEVINMLADEQHDVILTHGKYQKMNLDRYFRINSPSVFSIVITNAKEQNEKINSKADLHLRRPFEASRLWQTIASNVIRT